MAISRSSAKRLTTKPEWELVEASISTNARELSTARLRQKLSRARKLRDKYRDLARRQSGEARGKRKPQRTRGAQGSDNTERKLQLFREVVDRFETYVARAERRGTGPGRTAARKAAAKKTGTRKSAAKKTGAKKSTAKKAGAKKSPAKAGAKKSAAKKSGAKKATAKKAGAKKSPAKKSGGKKSASGKASGPAKGGARPAGPSQAAGMAPKGARQQPFSDAAQDARGRTARAHTRAANRRTQTRRDRH
jgi:hypothetical protein